jgi:hypothetical protein
LSVVTGPLNAGRPPKAWNTGSHTCASGWSSERSVVAWAGASVMEPRYNLRTSGRSSGGDVQVNAVWRL